MKCLHALLPSLCNTLFFLSATGTAVSTTTPQSINVALHAAFPRPPYLLELLETAAAENSSCFFPLLDLIASEHFAATSSDLELYNAFEAAVRDGSHLTEPAALSSWKLALSLHESAPRIEAQYQFWRTSVAGASGENGCGGKTYGVSTMLAYMDEADCFWGNCEGSGSECASTDESYNLKARDFDRTLGRLEKGLTMVLYADPSSKDFPRAYRKWKADNGGLGLPVVFRYMAPQSTSEDRLVVGGYGVELALKRTDYIVIDDRDAPDESISANRADEVILDSDKETADLRPLSNSELFFISAKTADFVMHSHQPFEVLKTVTQDFPKHAAALASQNVSDEFTREHNLNRDIYLTPGFSMLWLNGMKINPRDVDAFALLDQMRRERKLVGNMQELGFTAPEAISILSSPALGEATSADEPQRYDFRDHVEGGNVIIWLNNLERDKRYKTWPAENAAMLQRTFPGQPPQVRRDTHNLVFPVDFADMTDVTTVVETLQTFVKRGIALRVGLVPVLQTPAAIERTKMIYHLEQVYGLGAVIEYLQLGLQQNKLVKPNKALFEHVTAERKVRRDQASSTFDQVLDSEDLNTRVNYAIRYLERLGAHSTNPPIFMNGIPSPKSEEWMQVVGQRLTADVQKVQLAVYQKEVEEGSPLKEVFLKDASLTRNPLVIPEDESDAKLFDMGQLLKNLARDHALLFEPKFSTASNVSQKALVWVVLNRQDALAAEFLVNALMFALHRDDVDLSIYHSPINQNEDITAFQQISLNLIEESQSDLSKEDKNLVKEAVNRFFEQLQRLTADNLSLDHSLPLTLGLTSVDQAVVVNGRLVGPIPQSVLFSSKDFETLINYEQKKRIRPALAVLESLDILHKIETPQALARLSSTLALSTVSDVPEGIFDSASGPRMAPYEQWKSNQTCITLGEIDSATIQIVAAVDPASDTAQQWIPILDVLSQLENVNVRIFLNPASQNRELPVKRFFRQVLSAKPEFTATGDLVAAGAKFAGIPNEILLTMTMDVPASWLVAPKVSVHDLDNIKLSSIKDGSGIDAVYELESILIEGHTRDVTIGRPPRGAQLGLSTEQGEEVAGTIVMANLGYFQFKANPGVFQLSLQPGRSRDIFKIDSAGTKGYNAKDNTTEISLMSFKGCTLFPRLSRLPGRELDDVLETPSLTAENLAAKGAEVADSLFAKVGLPNVKTGGYLSKGLQFGQRLLSKTGVTSDAPASRHAEINIFSVASGHLYERMLNIMMVSVMRHTNHTVKFWFIEQFLSPSFKTFLPTMAEEYHFSYEMVTYKWPHWLRAQTEKQRVIWGYKILFLDVLFPLDLDKVIFVDADQIVRTDMHELVTHDLQGAPYAFTPMCDSRTEMEGFRFWKQGYWKNYLRDLPYHISALYVVDLLKFRTLAAGDRLRQQYHSLSADPNSLSNLDQDLPNHMQMLIPIHSLPQDWLWCETWCSDEALRDAKTIDLCNNPLTKEPKLDRARRQVPEWTVYDEEVAALAKRTRGADAVAANMRGGIQEEENRKEAPPASEIQAQKAKMTTDKHEEL